MKGSSMSSITLPSVGSSQWVSAGTLGTICLALLPAAMSLVALSRQVTTERLTRSVTPPAAELHAEAPRWFEPGETGVTYEAVLGKYIREEPSLVIVDSHIKSFRQIRNLRELLIGVVAPAATGPVDVRLVTAIADSSPEWEFGQTKALVELQEELVHHGITLKVEFDPANHDRWIETPAWQILLGKGLDFWDAWSSHNLPQESRRVAKRFAVTCSPKIVCSTP